MYIDDSDGFSVADTLATERNGMLRHANAARIVACVNACEGVSNEQLTGMRVAELLEALKSLLSVVSVRIDDPRINQFDAARAAIAKAEGVRS